MESSFELGIASRGERDILQDRGLNMTHYETLRDAQALDDHRVAVTFDSGTKAVFDCSGYFGQSYWKKLSDPVFFKSAHVEYGHLTWPGDIDISPIEVWEDAVRI